MWPYKKRNKLNMKIRIEGAYNEVFEKEWKGETTFEAENQLSVIADYLFQYKCELLQKANKETDETKKTIIFAKICHIEEILTNHADMFTFLHKSATAL